MALVSVIIPTFNRFHLLCRAVESVHAQSYRDFEVIVVDDGSTDETEVLFPQTFPHVRYLRMEHSGIPPIARNAALRTARGEYIAFLDSDDQWLPKKLEQQVEILDKNTNIGLVCSNAFVVSEGNGEKRSGVYLNAGQGTSGWVLHELLEDNFVILSTALIRRSTLTQVGVLPEEPLLRAIDDYDLGLRIAAVSEVYYICEPLALYRNNPSASNRGVYTGSVYWRARLRILERLRQFLEANKSADLLPKGVFTRHSVSYQEALCRALWWESRRIEAGMCAARLLCRHPLVAGRAVLKKAMRRVKGYFHADAQSGGSLKTRKATSNGLKLHLGCGEVHLAGYINIDFPLSQHSVQRISKADVHADITKLSYSPETVDEIRLHHVFEHFDRVAALRLLVEWYRWLKEDGMLVIETPDFSRCMQEFARRRNVDAQLKIIRHIFGAQEAPWAFHCDAWYREKFELILTSLGYGELAFSYGEWHGTYNITVTAKKRAPFRTREEQMKVVETFLRLGLVDASASEERLLKVWLAQLSEPGKSAQQK